MRNARLNVAGIGRALLTLACVGGLTALTGCGARPASSASPATPIEPAASTSPSTAVDSTPLDTPAEPAHIRTIHDTIGLTDEQDQMVLDAFTQHQTACMRAAGFDVETPTPGPLISHPVSGPPTVDELATSGYRWRAVRIENAAAASAAPTSRTDAEQSALDGCSLTAQREIGLDRLAPLDGALGNAENTIMQRALADAAYTSALSEWSACMATSGYDATDQNEAISLAGTLPGGLDGAEGIVVALTDFGCQTESGLSATLADLVARATDDWVAANPDTVARYRAATAAVLAAIG